MRWVGQMACIGKGTNAWRISVRELKRKKLLGNSRCRWQRNIKKIS
jgi:hypothetical protein